jgi:signal peptidase I
MQPNDPQKPKSTDGFRPVTNDYRQNTDGFGQPANYPQPQQYNQQLQPPKQASPSFGGSSLPSPTNQPVTGQNDYAGASKKKRREDIKNTIFTLALFILAPMFAIFMIVFVFQSYVVDGSSMEPTLQNNNRVFILKLPKSIANMQDKQWIPTRNEIIVFKKPGNEGTQLIKRVIGLPGDRVVIKDGKVTVYNIDEPQGFDPADGMDYKDAVASYDPEQSIEANVGEGELFVLGDNRTPGGSLDSHSGLGLVPVENVVGRLWLRYFPLSSFEVYASYLSKYSLAF